MPGLSGVANGPVGTQFHSLSEMVDEIWDPQLNITPTGNLLKGPVGPDGKLKDAALMVGIKLDLEAEVHLTARIRGDILIGLY